jgi:hypothetical protein
MQVNRLFFDIFEQFALERLCTFISIYKYLILFIVVTFFIFNKGKAIRFIFYDNIDEVYTLILFLSLGYLILNITS